MTITQSHLNIYCHLKRNIIYNITVLRDLTPCRLVDKYQHLAGTCCPYLHGTDVELKESGILQFSSVPPRKFPNSKSNETMKDLFYIISYALLFNPTNLSRIVLNTDSVAERIINK
jgi:hypothetical protein